MVFMVFTTKDKYVIVKQLQDRKNICGMVVDGVNDAPILMKANTRIVMADATDATKSYFDIVLFPTILPSGFDDFQIIMRDPK